MPLRPLVSTIALAACLSLLTPAPSAAENWPSFRGPFARGVADDHGLPAEWNLAAGQHIRWTAEIPGLGHSSPIVWGDRLFVTTAVSPAAGVLVLGDQGGTRQAGDEGAFSWRLYCLDQASGEILWQREAFAGKPRAPRHVKSSQANATPATDGKIVVALFGSEGLVAWDFTGKELWRKDLGILDPGLFGDPSSHWGHASSPVIHGGRVFVQVDRHRDSYVAAFDAASGRELWRVARDEKPVWATPTIHEEGGRAQLIVVGGDFDRGYDPETGKELWRFPRDYEVKTPTPFVAGDLVVLSGGYRGQPLYTVAAGAAGTAAAVWTSEPGGPYTSTPVAYEGLLYFVRDTGILTVLDLATGAQVYRERLDSTFSASPVAGDGKVFLTGEDGVVTVLAAGKELRVLSRNDFGEPTMATPAIASGTLFFRTRGKVVAIAAAAAGAPPEPQEGPAPPSSTATSSP